MNLLFEIVEDFSSTQPELFISSWCLFRRRAAMMSKSQTALQTRFK